MSNSGAQVAAIIEEWSSLLDEIADLQERVKELKARCKDEGWNVKALGQCVKEKRRGAEFQAAQLTYELEVDTHRSASGLPTTLEVAQAAVIREKSGVL